MTVFIFLLAIMHYLLLLNNLTTCNIIRVIFIVGKNIILKKLANYLRITFS